MNYEKGGPNVLSKANILVEKISHGHCLSMSDSWTRRKKKKNGSPSSIYLQISLAFKQTRLNDKEGLGLKMVFCVDDGCRGSRNHLWLIFMGLRRVLSGPISTIK